MRMAWVRQGNNHSVAVPKKLGKLVKQTTVLFAIVLNIWYNICVFRDRLYIKSEYTIRYEYMGEMSIFIM